MLKVGLVGCGFMGRMHSNVYSIVEGATLVGVYDKFGDRSRTFSEQFDCQSYSSFEDLLCWDLDVIDICLPTYLHKEYTILSAKAGKHVICEKPMALSLEEADEMISVCQQEGVQLMIGHCIRFWPEYVLLKEIIDDQRYGKLLSLNLTRYGEFPSWSSENWLADQSKSGGGVLDMHIHDTDFAHFVLGVPDQMVSFGTINQTGPAHVFTTQKYGEIVVHLEGGWNLPEKTPFCMSFRAIFENGAALYEGGVIRIYQNGCEVVTPKFSAMAVAGGGNIGDLGGYYHELKYFVDCISSGTCSTIVTPKSSRTSLATTLEEIAMIKARSKLVWNS